MANSEDESYLDPLINYICGQPIEINSIENGGQLSQPVDSANSDFQAIDDLLVESLKQSPELNMGGWTPEIDLNDVLAILSSEASSTDIQDENEVLNGSLLEDLNLPMNEVSQLNEINSVDVYLENYQQSPEVRSGLDFVETLYALPNVLDQNEHTRLPKLIIETQPKSNFAFNTPSEMKKKKFGPISATIKMDFANNSNINYENFFAICILCEKFDSNEIGYSYKPSLNFLANSKDDVNCKPRRLEHIGNGVFKLENYHILKGKKNEERVTIREKYVEYNKLIKNRDELKNAVIEKIENMITLGEMVTANANQIVYHSLMIEVFEDRNNERIRIPGAVYSNLFSNYILQFQIVTNTHFDTDGNGEIAIKVLNDIPTNFSVRIFNTGKNDITLWEEKITPNKLNINDKLISFQMPPYKPSTVDERHKIECWIEIISSEGSNLSQPKKFYYVNTNVRRKRTANRTNERETRRRLDKPPADTLSWDIDTRDTSFSPPIEEGFPFTTTCNQFEFSLFELFMRKPENPAFYSSRNTIEKYINEEETHIQKLRKILRSYRKENSAIFTYIDYLNSDYIEEHENEDTIFHEVIKSDFNIFQIMYEKRDSLNLQKLLSEASNCFGENLLHYACLYNKPHCIRPLIDMGCGICDEDQRYGETPLHIAIQMNDHECIKQFKMIFKNPHDYPEAIEDLKKLLTIYNYNGYTVMHLAILYKLQELMLDMLKFCKDNDIDACEIQDLCNGDTILHLAASQNLMDIVKCVEDYFPDALYYENYEGLTVFDIQESIKPELSTEMIQLIAKLEKSSV